MAVSEKQWFLYALIDPRTDDLRYIGKTTSPKRRYQEHLRGRTTREKSWKASWIQSVLNAGALPEMVLIESGIGEAWREREAHWIEELRDCCRLVNMREGGYGPSMVAISDETRKKISRAAKNRPPMSEAARQKLSAHNLGKKMSENVRAKLRGRKRSEQTKSRMAEAQRRRCGTEGVARTPPGPQSEKQPVIRVETGEVFESLRAAADAAGTSRERIRNAIAKGTRCFGYHYAKADDAAASVDMKHERCNRPRPVVCCTDGLRFDSTAKAAKHAGVTALSLTRALRMGYMVKGKVYRYEGEPIKYPHPFAKVEEGGAV